MSSNVEKHLTAKLAATAAVTALVSSRVYPVQAPQSADLPYIIYSRAATRFPSMKSEGASAGTGVATISLSSWASTYSAAKGLADAVRGAVDGWRDQTLEPKIDRGSVMDEADAILSPEEGKEMPEAYGVVHDIDVYFEES